MTRSRSIWRTRPIASAFVARWYIGHHAEATDGVYRIREDEPKPRVRAGDHKTRDRWTAIGPADAFPYMWAKTGEKHWLRWHGRAVDPRHLSRAIPDYRHCRDAVDG